MKNPLWFIIWLVVLIFIGFPVAGFCAGWYIIVYPLTVCIPGLSKWNEIIMGNVGWSLLWFLAFWFISFFIASFCAPWYILFYPFTVCIPGLEPFTDLLLKGVQFPHTCAKGIVEGTPMC